MSTGKRQGKGDQPLLLKEKYEWNQRQTELKQEHGIEEERVVVVERKSPVAQIWRTTLKYLVLLIRVLATVMIAILAIIGLSALIYPNIRIEFFVTFNQVVAELRGFLGM